MICLRASEVLLIRRGKAPTRGEWTLPGGRIEWGEQAAAAALRELWEETTVEAEVLGLVDVVDGIFPATSTEPERHFLLVDYAARWLFGEPNAGDDAAEARFWPLDQARRLVRWDETARVIAEAARRFGPC